MTTNYHTPIATGAAITAAAWNTPLATLDTKITTNDAAIEQIEAEIDVARKGRANLAASIENVRLVVATPSGQYDAGTPGDIVSDATYLYVCIGTDEWTRIPLIWTV